MDLWHRGLTLLVALLLAPLATAVTAEDGTTLADEETRFDDVTVQAGLGGLTYSRVAWGDYNGDGWEDLLLNGRSLWRNDGDGTFTDVTQAAGVRGVPAVGGVWADYDNDGDADFYAIVRSLTDGDALWRNEGDGTFTDVTGRSGDISDRLPSEGAAWGDYDGDGWVDLYVANYETASVDHDAPLGVGTPDVLYRNNGDGTFANVSAEAGVELDGEPLCGRGVVWSDYDGDGDQDIYVSNYRLDPNLLWRNNGDGTFTDVAQAARARGYASDISPGGPRFGHTIGSDFGDFDNDGDMDLFASNLAHPRFIAFSDKSMLLENRGGGAFVDRFYGSGIAYCETSSDPAWADYDNDGDLDLYFTAVYEGRHSRLFRNVGRDRFEDATGESRTSVENGWGVGWCDYDHDGDLDLAVGSGSGLRLLRNGGNANHWIEVGLEGLASNRMAIGARVRVSAGDLSLVREVKGGQGTTSQGMAACHFGLGGHTGTVDVMVRWPGETNWINHGAYAVDQRVSISQGDLNADAAVRLEVEPAEPRVGDAVDLLATVENVGDVRLDRVTVQFFVQGSGPVGPEHPVGPLEPDQEEGTSTLWQPLQEGVYTVLAQVTGSSPADSDPDNDVARRVVTVRATNAPPVARLRADRTEAPPGVAITLDGSESTDDTRVASYLFEFGDGAESGWQAGPAASHAYTREGEFLTSLTVRDGDGLQSTNFATLLVTVTSRGYRPTAEIVTVLPSPAREGGEVTLHGRGIAAEGARIVQHSWNSSRDGHLGDEALITVSGLSVGEHNLIYKVADDRGLWSDPATALLVVRPPEGTWTVRILRPREGSAQEGDSLEVSGTAEYSTAPVLAVEVRLDNGPWEGAEGTERWSHRVDLDGLADGPHTLRVRASSLDSESDPVMVNFTLGEVPAGDGFDWRGWLLSWQGVLTVVVVALVANALVYGARRRMAARRAA